MWISRPENMRSQHGVGAIVFGHDDEPAGVLVEPVHNAGPQVSAGGRKSLKAVQQRVHQRSAAARIVGCARAGVHHHSGRLVDHRQVLVLINHGQGNIFGDRFERCRARLAGDDDGLAAAQLQTRPSAVRRRAERRPAPEAAARANDSLHRAAPPGIDPDAGRRLLEERTCCAPHPLTVSSGTISWGSVLSSFAEHPGSQQHQHNRGHLRHIERAVEQLTAPFGIAPKFGEIKR